MIEALPLTGAERTALIEIANRVFEKVVDRVEPKNETLTRKQWDPGDYIDNHFFQDAMLPMTLVYADYLIDAFLVHLDRLGFASRCTVRHYGARPKRAARSNSGSQGHPDCAWPDPKEGFGQHPLLRPDGRDLDPEKVWSLSEDDAYGLCRLSLGRQWRKTLLPPLRMPGAVQRPPSALSVLGV